jgi:hypothetical protein
LSASPFLAITKQQKNFNPASPGLFILLPARKPSVKARRLGRQKGCFAVSSMREFAILPPEAAGIITRSRSKLKRLIAKNIEIERPKMNAESLAELVLTFFYRTQYGAQPEFEPALNRPQNRRSDEHSPNTVTNHCGSEDQSRDGRSSTGWQPRLLKNSLQLHGDGDDDLTDPKSFFLLVPGESASKT